MASHAPPDGATPAGGDEPDRPASQPILVIGFFVVLGLIVAAAVLIITQGGQERQLVATGPATTIVATLDAPTAHRDPAAPATTELHGSGLIPVTLELTMSAGARAFCGAVDLRIDYDAADDATVEIRDDADTVLFDGAWAPGATHTLQIDARTQELHAVITTRSPDPDAFHPSGNVSGKLC